MERTSTCPLVYVKTCLALFSSNLLTVGHENNPKNQVYSSAVGQ